MHANFPTRQTNRNFWVVVKRRVGSILVYWAEVSNVTQEPFYHSMFICNSTTLAIL